MFFEDDSEFAEDEKYYVDMEQKIDYLIKIANKFYNDRLSDIEAKSGPHYKLLISDRQYCEQQLENKSSDLRWAALQALSIHKTSEDYYIDIMLKFLNDENEDIRMAAMSGLATKLYGTQNIVICKNICKFIFEDNNSYHLIRKAYFSILDIMGYYDEAKSHKWENFKFPDDVNFILLSSINDPKFDR